jgi:hypothetical protein
LEWLLAQLLALRCSHKHSSYNKLPRRPMLDVEVICFYKRY